MCIEVVDETEPLTVTIPPMPSMAKEVEQFVEQRVRLLISSFIKSHKDRASLC